LLTIKLLIKEDKTLKNKKANKDKLILVSNKVSNIFLVLLISLLFFLISKIFFDLTLFIFFKQQN